MLWPASKERETGDIPDAQLSEASFQKKKKTRGNVHTRVMGRLIIPKTANDGGLKERPEVLKKESSGVRGSDHHAKSNTPRSKKGKKTFHRMDS